MVKQFLKKKSKRMPCRRRYKIEKKVRQHAKKLRREAKKNPKKKGRPKDPGVPNSLPFKDKILKEAQEWREQEIELKKRQKEERHNLLMEKRGLKDLAEDAAKRSQDFQALETEQHEEKVAPAKDDRNFRTFYREFHKVVEAADVILEVLDARDPLGSRCPQVEKAVLDAGPSKRLVLVLNKIDLVPKDNLRDWLKYLREEFPAVPFKASTQVQRTHLSRKTLSRFQQLDGGLPAVTSCLGAELLMKLLGNYCRSQDIRTSIRVGVVGFPNVGKSSIVNSLKRSRACSVGAVPGVTRRMQEVQLDKHVMLLDSPGVVLAQKSMDEAGAALRNAIKIESLEDAIPAVEAILRRTTVQQMMLYYKISKFDDSRHFLSLLAKRFGRLKRGGVPDVESAAKSIIRDWTMGKIKYYTKPPSNLDRPVHLSAEIVQQMAAEFDLASLSQTEDAEIFRMDCSGPLGTSDALEVSGTGFTSGTTEGLTFPDEQELPPSEGLMDLDTDADKDTLGAVDETTVEATRKSKTGRPQPVKKGRAAVDHSGMTAEQEAIRGNQCLNTIKKQSLKRLKKRKKRSEKMVEKLTESLVSAVKLDAPDTAYSFETDYK